MNKYKILIIDDDVDITLTFKTVLEGKGYVVETYNDPILALSTFCTNTYDLILIDIRMPGIHGFELAREILKIDHHAKISFITAFRIYYESLGEYIPKSKQLSFIRKPIENDELVKRVKLELGEQSPSL